METHGDHFFFGGNGDHFFYEESRHHECSHGGLWRLMKAVKPPAAFLVKTYMAVEDPKTDAVISWNDAGGTSFVVWQPGQFARDVLPTLFKHCNFSSFIRQLNTYGFRKVASNRWEFSNDMFLRGRRELLYRIRRRKSPAAAAMRPQPPLLSGASSTEAAAPSAPRGNMVMEEGRRSTSKPTPSRFGGYAGLLEENRRLKMENGRLKAELRAMKKKCGELVELVGGYSTLLGLKEEEDADKALIVFI